MELPISYATIGKGALNLLQEKQHPKAAKVRKRNDCISIQTGQDISFRLGPKNDYRHEAHAHPFLCPLSLSFDRRSYPMLRCA